MSNIKRKIYRIFTTLFCALALTKLAAQNESQFDELMSESGKIYNVVGVLVIIFIGLIIYLISTDRKVRKLQNQINSK